MSGFVDGNAGASARREYDRRSARDEQRTRQDWGRLGGIAVALTPERQSTRAWVTGEGGEVRVGRVLDPIASESIRVFHDRRIPRSKANIDHLVVTSRGVWVIDAKCYRGKRPELRVEGGILRPRVETLLLGGRDRTGLTEGVLRQVEQVRRIVPDTPVFGALCFVDADWPLLGGDFCVRGVAALWPKKLAELLKQDTGSVDVPSVSATIGAAFRGA